MRQWIRSRFLFSFFFFYSASYFSHPVLAENIYIDTAPINYIAGKNKGEKIGMLTWLGGIKLTSHHPKFGGISDVVTLPDTNKFIFISDSGLWVWGELENDLRNAPMHIINAGIQPILDSKGHPLKNKTTKDAEALDIFYSASDKPYLRVGFERLTRMADFNLQNGQPTGPSTLRKIPEEIAKIKNNSTIESLCVHHSPNGVQQTMLIAEDAEDEKGNHRAWLMSKNKTDKLSFHYTEGFLPTSCDYLPNGGMIILERKWSLVSFSAQLIYVAPEKLTQAITTPQRTTIKGTKIAHLKLGSVSNLEGLSIHVNEKNEYIMTLVSDDNYSNWMDTQLLRFSLKPTELENLE